MAEVMLEEIGRRPGSASKQAENSAAGINLHQASLGVGCVEEEEEGGDSWKKGEGRVGFLVRTGAHVLCFLRAGWPAAVQLSHLLLTWLLLIPVCTLGFITCHCVSTCCLSTCCCVCVRSCVQGVSQDREGYALAAGMALGLITLGRGRAALGLADLHLEERLR